VGMSGVLDVRSPWTFIPFALPPRPMTRIEITAAAYAALADSATRVASWSLYGAQRAVISSGWPRKVLKRLDAVRGPSESYSATILRLAEEAVRDVAVNRCANVRVSKDEQILGLYPYKLVD
jgi:hypothetical protein